MLKHFFHTPQRGCRVDPGRLLTLLSVSERRDKAEIPGKVMIEEYTCCGEQSRVYAGTVGRRNLGKGGIVASQLHAPRGSACRARDRCTHERQREQPHLSPRHDYLRRSGTWPSCGEIGNGTPRSSAAPAPILEAGFGGINST